MSAKTVVSKPETVDNDFMSEEVNRSVFEIFREMSAGKKPVFLDDKTAESNFKDLEERLDNLKADIKKLHPRRKS